MNQIAVEVLEDPRRPEGGHAVIRLRGLNVLPSPTDYHIEPVDGTDAAGEASDWPAGARRPVETRLTEQGVEIVAGPDVVESPHLLPGTPVVISVPAAGVEAEILWPDVTPLARTERRPVIALPDVLAMAAQQERQLQENPVNSHGSGHVNGNADGPRSALSSLKPHGAGSPSPVYVGGGQAPAVSAAPEDAGRARPSLRSRATVRRVPMQRATRRGAGPETLPPLAPGLALEGDGGEASAAGHRPMQRVEPAGEAPVADKASRRLAGIAIALAVVAALTSVLGNLLRPSVPGTPAAETSSAAVQAPAPMRPAGPAATLSEVIATGPVSPRGMSADGVTYAKALEQADMRLHGPPAGRDASEGAYWLKRAVAMSLSDPRTQWALTQLGSLYAEPAQGEPDYARARLLWEIAGGLGDPVALCFLGSLAEFGLGGSIDKAAAAQWYERAKRAGGCRQVDEALRRVRQ